MYTQDAENAPHKKKKNSSTSHAEKRSDHEHYYAADVIVFNYCNGSTYSYRRAVCIFCERRARMSDAKCNKLEEYRTFIYHMHTWASGHKREDCPTHPYREPYQRYRGRIV